MSVDDPVVLTCAISGVLANREQCPAIPYTPAEYAAEARRILGPGKLLCPEVMVLLETDPAKARAAARTALSSYIQLENYANNWRRLGFTDDDLAGGGSNRFVDANIAWGDEGAIRKRLQLFWDAGADHVCIQVLTSDPNAFPREQWRRIAAAMP